jgi:lysophospholipase L1-like esterase
MMKLKIMSKALLVMSLAMTSCQQQYIESPNKKIVMLGDSGIKQIDGQLSGVNQSSWNALMGHNNMINLGFNGYATANIISYGNPAPLALAIAEAPDLLYLSIGGNDGAAGQGSGVSLATTMANLENICNQIKAANIPFVIVSVLPFTKIRNETAGGGVGIFNDNFQNMNDAIIQFCADNEYECMDIRPYVCYRENGLWHLRDSLTFDGVHLTFEGYEQWAIPLSYSINQH